MRVYRVIERHVTLAREYVDSQAKAGVTFDGSPLCCHASTRKGTRASACRCRAASTARRTSTSRRLRRSRSAAALAPRAPGPGVLRVRFRRMLLGVDVGGTFTDAVLLDGDRLVTGKAPPTPDDQSEGVMAAVDAALEAAGAEAGDVERFVHGMTVGTNALLEGKVARTALLATEGFTDLEELGRQARPELYRLCAGHPPPLVPPSCGSPAPERCGPDGVLRELDEDALRERARAALDDVEAVAVCLLWGFRHPEHEQRVAELVAEALPDAHVSTSHETAGVFREYERCATTIVDAALSPLLRRYLERLAERAERRGAARARGHALQRRRGRRRHRRARTAPGPCCRARRRRGGRGADGRGGRRRRARSASTWAAPRATCRWRCDGRVAVHRRPRGGRPGARAADGRRAHGRRRAAAASPGATRAARCAWARARRAPTPAPPVTAAAARSPP